MIYSRFRAGMVMRTVALFLTIVLASWMIVHTQWYVSISLCVTAVLAQTTMLLRFSTHSSREVARFLDAISLDDTSQSFCRLSGDSAHIELGAAMERVLTRLRAGRSEREEQAHYLRTLIAHVPIALVSADECGKVNLLNMAARRLFETSISETTQFARHGAAFAVGIESLSTGSTAILRMERAAGMLQLKAAATDVATRGVRHRLISLQNIENEMNAQEMVAWQTVIRVMAHEVMNSLTPVASLTDTAHDLIHDVLKQLPVDDPHAVTLTDARDALETVGRRSKGLLRFVQSHGRLTKRLETQIEVAPMRRVFARLQRLLANDLASRDIRMTANVEPETLELAADPELLDQALINLVRNAIEALRGMSAGLIALSARCGPDGRIAIAVADNGPGIASDQREKIFVPFFTTKRQGSGVGLTLVRQITTAHGASIHVSQTPGGGATFVLRF